MKRALCVLLSVLTLAAVLSLSACQEGSGSLPPPETDASSEFGVDVNINMETIDQYLDREDVAYRDVRMLFDPADYAAIGGLRLEARQKLSAIRPLNLGQASRISGVSPADVAVLLIYLQQNGL